MCDLSVCWSAVRARDRCCCCCCWPKVNSRQKSWSSEAEWKLKLWLLTVTSRKKADPASSADSQKRRKKTLATTVINSGELNWTLNWTLSLLVSQCKCVCVHFCHSLLLQTFAHSFPSAQKQCRLIDFLFDSSVFTVWTVDQQTHLLIS